MPDEWVWLRHKKTKGIARFSARSVPAWRDKGWLPIKPESKTSNKDNTNG